MKKHLLSQAAVLCLLATTTLFSSLPAGAAGQAPITAAAPAPFTRGLEVNADSGVAPGSQLRLTLEGSAGGEASARIPGPNVLVPLKEIAPGQYSGRYTVRQTDRIDPSAVIRVSLTAARQTVVANYTFPPSFMAPVTSAPAPATRQIVIASPVPATVQVPIVIAAPQPLRIERFAVAPVGRAEPGAELLFRLDGMPGATASLDIPGVVSEVPMRELRPGHYEGTYTIRRQDNLAAAGLATAKLRAADNRVTSVTLSQPLIAADNRPPQIANLVPREGETVPRGATFVSGSFEDGNGTGVDPRSVRIVVSGRDVTSLAQITPREFAYQGPLPAGRHTVEVIAADRAGNIVQKTWSFDVGGSVLGAASAGLPLTVMSHANNAQVDQQLTTIRGRTAPGAMVRVRVDAIAPIGRRASSGVAEQLLSEAVLADANGDFSFTFNPRYVRDNATSLPVPGTRYDISISAQRDNQTAESRLMLFQRG